MSFRSAFSKIIKKDVTHAVEKRKPGEV